MGQRSSTLAGTYTKTWYIGEGMKLCISNHRLSSRVYLMVGLVENIHRSIILILLTECSKLVLRHRLTYPWPSLYLILNRN